METTNSFGYWLRRQRKALDLTQQVLAERVGCSLAAIKKIESDERRPSRQIAERLADILGVPSSQRQVFLEAARGLRSVEQLSLAQKPASPLLPSGTVTFLYTDIEGSTKLAQEYPEEWETLRAKHDAILREAIGSNSGYVFQVVGDGFCATFHTPKDGFHAAIDAQRKLQTENWGTIPIKVRMGIHTGEAEAHDNEYLGYLTISLVQRLMSAGHGGQILLSHATENLLRGHLPQDISLLDLGEHKFKDIFQLVHVFQVIVPELQKEFPALGALDVFPNNLPIQLTSFIGRERELAEVKQLLSNTRLLTLTGPGGTGKTRLSLQIAQEVLPEFTNGVWLVELAPLTDPSLLPQTIASVFALREIPNTPLLDLLTNYLRAKQLLLILDNCEHLIETCAKLSADLLHACPQLKIIASSREALGMSGETVYRVPSLSLPDPAQVTREAIVNTESIQLFVERAMAVQSHFVLTDSNASAATQICHRLDGIPLALELAAARIAVFSLEEIASRLDDRFRLLTGGSRTALERHQTLRALIDWSYDLLSDDERRLFRQLSVFAGGWRFEGAEAVCADLDVLKLLTQLVNKSLVMVDEQGERTRYRLPETVRQYARDKLLESGDAEQVRDRHLDFFLHFAEEAEPKLRSGEQLVWLDRLQTEHDNLRTALGWSLESGKSDGALQLAGALYYFWLLRGYFSEGQKWLDDTLTLSEREQSKKVAAGKYMPTRVEMVQHAKALYASGYFHLATLNLKRARTLVEESLRMFRELGDKWWMAVTLELKGLTMSMDENQATISYLEEGVSLARQVQDPWPLALCLVRLGDNLKVEGKDMAAARRFLEEGVAVARKTGDKGVLSEGLRELGSSYYGEGHLTAAAAAIEEALTEARAIGSIFSVILALGESVIISCLQNNLLKAKGYCFELWVIGQETGVLMATGFALLAFGLAASFGGEPGKGVCLLAMTDRMFRHRGVNFTSGNSPLIKVYKQALEKAQAQLGPSAFAAAQAEGQQMTLEQAIALATENDSQDSQLTSLDSD
jgi:predicted ATPase/class 3 adenylate cyclase